VIKNKGFSLLELMMVVAIVGIITAVALPYFGEQGMRGKRVEAKNLLLEMASKQQQFFSQYVSFTTTIVGAGGCGGIACGLNYTSDLSVQQRYKMTIAVAPAGCAPGTASNCRTYTITATPTGDYADADCAALTYTSTAVKGRTGSGASIQDCWR